jgi:hypothetical protein
VKKPSDDSPEEKFEDPFKIPYHILPLAPPPSTKEPSLWELFLLGFERAPRFPTTPLFENKGRSA